MRRVRKTHASVGAALLIALLSAGHWLTTHHRSFIPRPAAPTATAQGGTHHVTYVYDGDTIKIDNEERVRLIGIDTPETHDNVKLQRDVQRRHLNKEVQLAMGEKAAEVMRRLVTDQDVRLEYDVEQRDRYHRLLAYVYLTDGTFVNEKIIREGYAYPLTIPPNVRYADKFKQWFDEAREQKRGLWNE
jgi:micrococcal nuclease